MPSRPYYADVPLRWSDMDALRHINNVQFARLLEEARIVALRDWFPARDGQSATPSLLVARQEIDYLAQLRYRSEPIVIATWVTKISGASFDISYEVLSSRDEGAEVYARAESTLVTFDMESQRPRRITPEDRALLEAVKGEPVPMKRRALERQ
ncbi:acyl-CoA thioesterase [Demetria terragena]|uniref:acyl-CoA thioesterase n=1 Tax=Demetria terragena TaxID=63959 RepID=UPI00037A54FE|nr:thioesterase family protein [Demetria terragena]